jgi:regulatory protein
MLAIEQKMQKTSETKEAENAALRYLARRDYSRRELYQRLIRKGMQSTIVNQVLDDLHSKGYQSDERFAEVYIRSRINAGDGPFKIKISLRAKGICDSLALAVIDNLNVDWFDRAQALKRKRFGEVETKDLDETAKQMRYLKNKGFYQDHINAVVHNHQHCC